MSQLVFLPGLAADSVMWQRQLDAMPAQFHAVVSDVHSRHASLPAMAESLLQEHGGELILCGASMGGMLAMEVVHQAPQRVKALALLGTSARPEAEAMRALREAAIHLFEEGRIDEVLQANLPLAFHPSRRDDLMLRQSYLDFVLHAGAQQLIRQNRAVMARADARLHLAAVDCPTLVMCGDSDQLTPPECSLEIAQLIKGAEFVMLRQCGHMLTMERPTEVNARLLQWLAALRPG
jgi:pimeloyl-ACP methyl ester carboxylesterase